MWTVGDLGIEQIFNLFSVGLDSSFLPGKDRWKCLWGCEKFKWKCHLRILGCASDWEYFDLRVIQLSLIQKDTILLVF